MRASSKETGVNVNHPNILLTSVGRRSYLVAWFKEALEGIGAVHAINSVYATTGMAAADVKQVSPPIYSEEYIPYLIEYCKGNGIGAVIPLFDPDVPVLAAHKQEFESIGARVVVPDAREAIICNDKYLTWKTLADCGVRAVRTYIRLEDCIADIEQGATAFPLVVKPRWGMGSIGVMVATTIGELAFAHDYVLRCVKESHIRHESQPNLDEAVVMQPMVHGREYGMDVMNDLGGNFRAAAVRRKIAMRAGETDVAEVCVTDERFEELARNLAGIIHHPGNLDVDVFEMDGELAVLEMNARFGGGYPFSHAAGVDLPRALVSWLRGQDCDRRWLQPKCYQTYAKDIVITPLAPAEAEHASGCLP